MGDSTRSDGWTYPKTSLDRVAAAALVLDAALADLEREGPPPDDVRAEVASTREDVRFVVEYALTRVARERAAELAGRPA